jgi:hypothetical protein
MPEVLDQNSTPAQNDAVAQLCYAAFKSVDAHYGCKGTSANTSCWWAGCSSIEKSLNNLFRYRNDYSADREDNSQVEWFELLKKDLNNRQPVQVRIPGHGIVLDGWQEIGRGPIRQFHVNYGWGPFPTDNLGWYAVDEIPEALPEQGVVEGTYALINMRPDKSLGSQLNSLYLPELLFPYLYVNQDAYGAGVLFGGAFNLQFLPGRKIIGRGGDNSPIRIGCSSQCTTRLFLGDRPGTGVVISGGSIKLSNGGGITLAPVGAPRYLRAWKNPEFGFVSLAWEPGYAHEETVIERFEANTWREVGVTRRAQTGFLDQNIAPNVQYKYRVRGRRGTSLSEYSRAAEVM